MNARFLKHAVFAASNDRIVWFGNKPRKQCSTCLNFAPLAAKDCPHCKVRKASRKKVRKKG